MDRFSTRLLFRIGILIAAFVLLSPGNFQDGQAFSSLMITSKHHVHPPGNLWGGTGARYFEKRAKNGSYVHVVSADAKSGKWIIKPALNITPMAPSRTADRLKASAAVNGGYFNHQDGSPVGYVVIDRRMVVDLKKNRGLMNDPALTPSVLNAILNRCELRVLLDNDGNYTMVIASHNQPIPKGKVLLHSLQAGPRLLPKMTLVEEAFIRRNRYGQIVDVIRSTDRAARTAIGITTNGQILIVSVAGPEQGTGSPGLTLPEFAEALKDLGCREAINLDGGNSSTMFVRFASNRSSSFPTGTVIVGKHPEVAVPSVVLLERLK